MRITLSVVGGEAVLYRRGDVVESVGFWEEKGREVSDARGRRRDRETEISQRKNEKAAITRV